MERKNIIAKWLFYIGVIIIIGNIINGFMSGTYGLVDVSPLGNQFSMLVFISSSIRGLTIGMLFIGLSEVLHLLQNIFNSHKKLSSDMQVIRSTVAGIENKPLD